MIMRSIACTRRTAIAQAAAALMIPPAGLGVRTGVLRVADFRRPGLDDRAVLAAAFQEWQRLGGGVLWLEPRRTYDLGLVTGGPSLFSLTRLSGASLEGNGATLVARSDRGNAWNLLSFSSVSDLRISNLAFADSAYRGEAWGMKALVFQPGMDGTRNILLDAIRGDHLLSLVQTQGPFENAPRVSGITLTGDCTAQECYYALCCQNQGDDISGTIRALNCRRGYMAFGVVGHRLALLIYHEGGGVVSASRSPVLIKSYGRPTSNLDIVVVFTGTLAYYGLSSSDPGSCVMLEDQSASGAINMIRAISLEIDVSEAVPGKNLPYLLCFSRVAKSGTPLRNAVRSWSDIKIDVHSSRKMRIAVPADLREPIGMHLAGDVATAQLVRYP